MALPDEVRRGGDHRREVAVLTLIGAQRREGKAGPYRWLAFDSLGSTNDEAMARLRGGDPGGLMVTAARQSGGRGRQGRAWQSPLGNLYASLALRLDVAPGVAPQLGFVAGVALAGVLRARLGGDTRLRIKWPNDMTFGGAKLAGILLESTWLGDGRLGCVFGFGVNCRSHPDDLPYPAADLAAAGDPTPDPELILPALADALAKSLSIWASGSHFSVIRQNWLGFAVDLGTPLAVALADKRVVGTFQGLDASGRLLLATEDGRLVVDAGDVFLPEMISTSI